MTSGRLLVVRCLALLVVAFGGTYMVWRWSSTIAWGAWWIAIPLVLAETYSFGESVLYGVTMWNSRRRPAPPRRRRAVGPSTSSSRRTTSHSRSCSRRRSRRAT